jgi:ArsR family transcriptional regulator
MNSCSDIIEAMSHGTKHPTPSITDADTAELIAETMQALSTPSRVRILAHLRDGPCAVGELAEAVGMEASAVSHQLRVLRYLRLVTGERQGRNVVYALHDSHVGVLLQEATNHVAHLRLDQAEFGSEAVS